MLRLCLRVRRRGIWFARRKNSGFGLSRSCAIGGDDSRRRYVCATASAVNVPSRLPHRCGRVNQRGFSCRCRVGKPVADNMRAAVIICKYSSIRGLCARGNRITAAVRCLMPESISRPDERRDVLDLLRGCLQHVLVDLGSHCRHHRADSHANDRASDADFG